MKILSSLLFIISFSVITSSVSAQLVNGCGFLQQNRLEIGIANNGAYGTPENAPVGYHPNNNPLISNTYNPVTGAFIQHTNALGFVADYDSNGWSVGTPPYFGDYFLPGTPQEGWSVDINGVRCDAFSSAYQISGSTGYTGTLTGSNTNDTTTLRIKLGGTTVGTLVTGTFSVLDGFRSEIVCTGSATQLTISQKIFSGGTLASTVKTTIDTSASVDLTFTLQLSATSRTAAIEGVHVEVYPA